MPSATVTVPTEENNSYTNADYSLLIMHWISSLVLITPPFYRMIQSMANVFTSSERADLIRVASLRVASLRVHLHNHEYLISTATIQSTYPGQTSYTLNTL